jgi:hypothetical protein
LYNLFVGTAFCNRCPYVLDNLHFLPVFLRSILLKIDKNNQPILENNNNNDKNKGNSKKNENNNNNNGNHKNINNKNDDDASLTSSVAMKSKSLSSSMFIAIEPIDMEDDLNERERYVVSGGETWISEGLRYQDELGLVGCASQTSGCK